MNELSVVFLYLLGVNLVSIILMRIDKRKAVKQNYRIPERTFWGISLLGGAAGSILGMYIFNHKTKHKTFRIGMPIILVINISLIFIMLNIM